MSIIRVKTIPKPKHTPPEEPFNYRDKLFKDIRKAYDKRIDKFVFIGYPNANYASSFARNIALRFLQEELYTPIRRKVRETLVKEFSHKLKKAVKYIRVDVPSSAEPAIKIHGVTVHDVKKVYGEIDFEYIDNFENILLEKYRKYYSDKKVQKELKDILEREIQREKNS